MEYRTLGGTGFRVSTHCLGTMMFGAWGNPDRDAAVRAVNMALDGGVNFVDTADVYSAGGSEEIVGAALKGRRDEVVLATKFHGRMGTGENDQGNSRLWIMREVESSLRRLQTDHIDLYQAHRPDPDTDIEETLSALTDLVRQGKIRAFGSSTFPAWQIVEAQWVSERRGLERFRCEQPPYSIMTRGIERDVLPVAQAYGMGVIVWSPLSRGWLTGKYRREADPEPDSRAGRAKERGDFVVRQFDRSLPEIQRKMDVVDALRPVADKAGISMSHMAIAFAIAHPGVTSAILGPRTPEQVEDLLAGADIRLDADTLDAIDQIVPPGELVDENDRGYTPPWMEPHARRR
ncbi:MAG TPA: aldo/keto reductase [Actinomycetota bacterium]|nr:aldo/keto reductase [Actinomycetota bacterium]